MGVSIKDLRFRQYWINSLRENFYILILNTLRVSYLLIQNKKVSKLKKIVLYFHLTLWGMRFKKKCTCCTEIFFYILFIYWKERSIEKKNM